MPNYTLPGLIDPTTGVFLDNPPIVAGDFKISIAGAASVNLTNLPTARGAGSTLVDVVLSDVEDVANAQVFVVDQDSTWVGPVWWYPFEPSATSANQLAIIAAISGGVIHAGNPVNPNTNEITIVRNASYDGVAKDKLGFATTKDYTGWSGLLTIRHRTTAIQLMQVSVVVVSSTLLNATVLVADSAFTLLLDSTDFGNHYYDITMTSGVSSDVLGPYVADLRIDAKTANP